MIAPAHENPPPHQQEPSSQAQEKPWLRQEGESVLWYNRFKRYRNLNYKRSLQAAVQQEREEYTALESPKNSTPGKEKGQKRSKAVKLVTVTQAVEVPGSWKAASVKWRWVERAKAFDEWRLDQFTELNMKMWLEQRNTLPMDRVLILNSLYENTLKSFNANRARMSYMEECAVIARIQSLLKDIREEMKGYDESIMRYFTRYRLEERFKKNLTPFGTATE